MRNSSRTSAANPRALRLVLALAGVFVLVLLGVRLAHLAEFAYLTLDRMPFVLVEPGILGDFVLAVAIVFAPLVFLLPRTWRMGAVVVLVAGALVGVAISGSLTARGGPNVTHTPVAHWLQSRGYSRCPAGDRIRGSGRATRAEHVAEGWAQPGACLAHSAATGNARRVTTPN